MLPSPHSSRISAACALRAVSTAEACLDIQLSHRFVLPMLLNSLRSPHGPVFIPPEMRFIAVLFAIQCVLSLGQELNNDAEPWVEEPMSDGLPVLLCAFAQAFPQVCY